MKDAQGHGSNPKGAHTEGTDQIGQPKVYTWTDLSKTSSSKGHVLAVNGNLADQVGNVGPQTDNVGKKWYVGRYSYNDPSGGNAPSGYSHHGSVQGAKRYVEASLAKFWNPPKIGK